MRILITGSSGFIGTNFIKNSSDLSFVEVDLLTQKVDDINFFDVNSVLHLAALVHQMKGAPEEQYFNINRDLAFEVAKKAKSQGVKQFIFMSTAKVFGESTTGKPAWNENSECNPIDPYGKSKHEAEKLLLGLQDENFKIAIVRSPLVYGVGVKANMYNLVKLVNRFFVLPLGEIDNVRSMVYVGNLVALLKHVIHIQASGIFIAGDQEPLSTTRLVQLIAEASNKSVVLFKVPIFMISVMKKVRPSIVDRLFGSLELDNTSTNKRLNFVPPYSSEDGIREMVQWYKKSKK
jgi:nucleoside-diphosphate-sugar epimerase